MQKVDLRENALQCLEACSFMDDPQCSLCPQEGPGLGYACREAMRKLAIAALKAQGASVMSVEEAAKNAYSYYHMPDSVKPVFVQFRDETYRDEGLTPPWRGGVNQRALLKEPNRYGKDFVFWTDRPSEEQMKGVEWVG